jgi:hypothetical protein
MNDKILNGMNDNEQKVSNLVELMPERMQQHKKIRKSNDSTNKIS